MVCPVMYSSDLCPAYRVQFSLNIEMIFVVECLFPVIKLIQPEFLFRKFKDIKIKLLNLCHVVNIEFWQLSGQFRALDRIYFIPFVMRNNKQLIVFDRLEIVMIVYFFWIKENLQLCLCKSPLPQNKVSRRYLVPVRSS